MTSPHNLCRHFGLCGGCALQNQRYEDQLKNKETLIREMLAPYSPRRFRPILSSPDIFFYRNKMEFAFSGLKQGPCLLGLREKDRFDRVVDLQECFLMSPETPVLLEAARRWATKERLPSYHWKAHKGFLRYLVLREGKNTGERMVHLVTAEGDLPRESFLQALEGSGVRADTVVWSVNAAVSDVAYGQVRAVLRGGGTIREKLGEIAFQISPTTFFQTNTKGAEKLYQAISEFIGPQAETLIDFYCGSGSIGLYCARQAQRLVGVESHSAAVEDARANARRQGVENAEFLAMDAAGFGSHPELLFLWQQPGTVAVMDPPRAGLQPAVRRLLLEHPVNRWVYVSCNPKALAMDLPHLNSLYQVEEVQPVDLFPHTPHVETALLLQKRTS